MRYINCFFVLPMILLLVAIGCGQGQRLRGKVTFPDGEPLTVGTVIFSKPGFISRSFIMPDGGFDVLSRKKGDGIPPGTYKVCIIEALAPVDPNDPTNDKMKPLVDVLFTDPKTTPLEITIPGDKVYNITVERPKTK